MKKILFNAVYDVPAKITYRSLVIFNKGEYRPEKTYVLYDRTTNREYPTKITPSGLLHEDDSVWFAYVDAVLTLTAPKELELIEQPVATVVPDIVFEGAALTLLNKLRIIGYYKPTGSEDSVLNYADLMAPGNATTTLPVVQGYKAAIVYKTVINECTFVLRIHYGSNEHFLRYDLQILNDRGETTPGQLSGDWKIMFYSAFGGSAYDKALGVTIDAVSFDKIKYVTHKLNLGRISVGQSWFWSGVIADTLPDTWNYSKYLPVGIMTRDTLDTVELPEFQMPRASAVYKRQLQDQVTQRYRSFENDTLSAWDSLGVSLYPPGSGMQPQFGNFPESVRAVLELQTPEALMNLFLQETRMMAARPGWLQGLKYVDAGNKDNPKQDSCYTWMDMPHRTSLQQYGLQRLTNFGDYNGWHGQDAEHYGMTPAFWLALLTGDAVIHAMFAHRVTVAQCHWHTAYYFGSWTDNIRAEGRTASVIYQGLLLTGDSGLSTHLAKRAKKVIDEFKNANTFDISNQDLSKYTYYSNYVGNGIIPAPYGNRGSRFRPDARCPGYPVDNNPQSIHVWMLGLPFQAYGKIAYKYNLPNAKEIVKDMISMFVKHGWTETQGMKKYYAADNSRSYGPVGFSLDALTRWPANLIQGIDQEIYDSLDEEAKNQFWRVKTILETQWPDMADTPWCSAPWNRYPQKPE